MGGKWIAYMPMFLAVVFGDITCGKNQFAYHPSNYGQYVDPATDRIWTIMDQDYLRQAYVDGVLNASSAWMISYDARRNKTTGLALDNTTAQTDVLLNSRFTEHYFFFAFAGITDGELLMFLIGFAIAIWFAVMVFFGERIWKKDLKLRWLARLANGEAGHAHE